MATVFEQILDTNAIEVDDDGSLAKLLAAAGDVEKLIRSFKISPAAAVLVAMDSDIAADEPVLEEVQAVVKKHWPTLRRRHVEMPIALLRAVITEALSRAAKDDGVSSILWLTGASYAPYAPAGAEAPVWTNLLRDWGTKAQSAAAKAWASPDSAATVSTEAKLPVPSFTARTIETEWLAPRLTAAVGPMATPPDGVSVNTNQIVVSYRGEQVHQPWALAFGKTAAGAISDGLMSAMQESLKSANFDPFVTAVESRLQTASQSVAAGLAPLHAVELRSQVLLWDRAHFSELLERGYREVSPEVAAVAMAADLAAIVPPMSPRSIDFLLWESVRDVVGDASLSFGQFADTLIAHERELGVLLGTGAVPDDNRRGTLLQFVRRAITETGAVDRIRQRVGVERDHEVGLTDLARWIFRDIRAEVIAPRARRRK